MHPSEEREQDLAPDSLQPVFEDQREAGRSEQHPRARNQTQSVQRASHVPRRRHHPSARRRRKETFYCRREFPFLDGAHPLGYQFDF